MTEINWWNWYYIAAILTVIFVPTIIRLGCRLHCQERHRQIYKKIKKESMIFLIRAAIIASTFSIFTRDEPVPHWTIITSDITFITLLLIISIRVINIIFDEITETNQKSEHALNLVKTLIKVFLTVIAAGLIFEELGYRLTTLVASLGIGGLAVTLAARELLSNILGLIIILWQRPFVVGDMIEIGVKRGQVLNIGLRRFEIQQENGNIVSVPNQKVMSDFVSQLTSTKTKKDNPVFLK